MLFSVAKNGLFVENNLPISSNLSYAPSCLLKFSFGERVKDEANPICAAEGKRKLRFLSENPIWNLIEKAGAEAGGAGRAGGATG